MRYCFVAEFVAERCIYALSRMYNVKLYCSVPCSRIVPRIAILEIAILEIAILEANFQNIYMLVERRILVSNINRGGTRSIGITLLL